jgi:hypothetical protein
MRTLPLPASWLAAVLSGVLGLGSPLTSDHPSMEAAEESATAIVDDSPDPALDSGSGAGDERLPVAVPEPPRPADPSSHLLVRVRHAMPARAEPRSGSRAIGVVPGRSRYFDEPISAWIEEVSADGRWGRVEIPYAWPRRHGWIALRGLARRITRVEVHIDLSERRIAVEKFGRMRFRMPAAVGAPATPTPPGEYFVTDRIAFGGGAYGTFAFGISGVQPRLPSGWSAGDQLAIHGTNDPASIGRAVSAGCVRVNERTLDRLKPLLRPGTPVIVVP